MLDAIASVVSRNLDFDFFINLSDADMSLRTNEEVVGFLRRYKGRQFVQAPAGQRGAARRRRDTAETLPSAPYARSFERRHRGAFPRHFRDSPPTLLRGLHRRGGKWVEDARTLVLRRRSST